MESVARPGSPVPAAAAAAAAAAPAAEASRWESVKNFFAEKRENLYNFVDERIENQLCKAECLEIREEDGEDVKADGVIKTAVKTVAFVLAFIFVDLVRALFVAAKDAICSCSKKEASEAADGAGDDASVGGVPADELPGSRAGATSPARFGTDPFADVAEKPAGVPSASAAAAATAAGPNSAAVNDAAQ